jgi:hypothetical protein
MGKKKMENWVRTDLEDQPYLRERQLKKLNRRIKSSQKEAILICR